MSGIYPERMQATAPGRAAAPTAGQALNRVRDLARAWATLQASPGGDAGEVPARAGRTLLDVIHFNWGSGAEEILRLVTRIAEDWLSPGADLFCPAAGQEVLDVIKGDAASGPHARIAREHLGRVVRQAWVQWAWEQPGAKPSWLIPWEELDDGQREVDMRIGEAVADAAIAAAGLAKSPDQVGIIAGTMAACERDKAAPGQADEIPDSYARYIRATFPPEVLLNAPNEITGRWKHMTGLREREFWRSLDVAAAETPRYRAALAQIASMAEARGAVRNVGNIAKVATQALEGK